MSLNLIQIIHDRQINAKAWWSGSSLGHNERVMTGVINFLWTSRLTFLHEQIGLNHNNGLNPVGLIIFVPMMANKGNLLCGSLTHRQELFRWICKKEVF